MRFFDLTVQEAHFLLCDCHYGAGIGTEAIARRARALARKVSLGELWLAFRDFIVALWQR